MSRAGQGVTAGLEALADGRFHAAHELLEPHWRRAGGDRRLLLQALIQLAAGLHHAERGRRGPAARLLAMAAGKAAAAGPVAGLPAPSRVAAAAAGAARRLAGGVPPSAPHLLPEG